MEEWRNGMESRGKGSEEKEERNEAMKEDIRGN